MVAVVNTLSDIDILRLVSAFLENPKHWTKGVGARDHEGKHVAVGDPMASCWCLIGTVGKVCQVGPDWTSLQVPSEKIPDSAIKAAGVLVALRKHGSEYLRMHHYNRSMIAPCCEPSVTAFNDHPDTTLQDVQRFLNFVITSMEFDAAHAS